MKKSFLKGNILCALPQLKDIFFSKSLIYLTHHSKDGAVGIILNYKIMNIKGIDLFNKLNIKSNDSNSNISFPFHVGGPMSQNNGFILHSNDYKNKSTIKVSKKVFLTVSTDILIDIAKGKGPKDFFISLGYSGWGPGQLEDEIKNNSWINLNEHMDLLFDKNIEEKWNTAIKRTGIDFSKFLNLSGNA